MPGLVRTTIQGPMAACQPDATAVWVVLKNSSCSNVDKNSLSAFHTFSCVPRRTCCMHVIQVSCFLTAFQCLRSLLFLYFFLFVFIWTTITVHDEDMKFSLLCFIVKTTANWNHETVTALTAASHLTNIVLWNKSNQLCVFTVERLEQDTFLYVARYCSNMKISCSCEIWRLCHGVWVTLIVV